LADPIKSYIHAPTPELLAARLGEFRANGYAVLSHVPDVDRPRWHTVTVKKEAVQVDDPDRPKSARKVRAPRNNDHLPTAINLG
jgi:hypothetical protein